MLRLRRPKRNKQRMKLPKPNQKVQCLIRLRKTRSRTSQKVISHRRAKVRNQARISQQRKNLPKETLIRSPKKIKRRRCQLSLVLKN